MQVQQINNNPNFGIVKYNRAGLERLNTKLGANAKDFIETQKNKQFCRYIFVGK